MEEFLNDWGLSLAIFVPLIGAAISLLIPREQESAHKLIALVASLATALVGILLIANFDYDASQKLQFFQDHPWIDAIDSRYIVGLDGISLPLMALTMLIVPLCIVYSYDHIPEPGNAKAFMILILVLETGMIGTFLAQDLI